MSVDDNEEISRQIRRITGQLGGKSSRRSLLRQMAGVSLGLPLAHALPLLGQASGQRDANQQQSSQPHKTPALPPTPSALSPQDDQLLDEIERASFLYFWEQANPQTGLIKDRCNTRTKDNSIVASMASTGFGLTAICIADHRGFISHNEARLRVINTLLFIWKKLPTHRGFFYHFANINTGERIWDSEVSSVDTAILLCGILTCRQHFEDHGVTGLSDAIFNRVDWTWLSE